MTNYYWDEIAFKNKDTIREKNYVFIAGFRQLSSQRIIEIIKENIVKSNILVGILKDEYIEGFDNQAQFKVMNSKKLLLLIEKLSSLKLKNQIDSIEYFQRDTATIIDKLKPYKVIFINGSWSRSFHLRSEYFTLSKNKIKYNLISPFVSEEEALEYLKNMNTNLRNVSKYSRSKSYTDEEIFNLLKLEASTSFATDYQTSCALVSDSKVVLLTHNEVVPFETYALHYGSLKEKNFAPPNDLNHFDTIHAEMLLLTQAIEKSIDLKDKSLYINLLPCPTCAKSLSQCGLKEVVYSHDHSDGYAIKLFERVGIKTRRFLN